MAIHPKILEDIGPIITTLLAHGYSVVEDSYDAQQFGDYQVRFIGKARTFDIVKDRGQFMLYGKRDELEPIGLWRAYNTPEEFCRDVLKWVAMWSK